MRLSSGQHDAHANPSAAYRKRQDLCARVWAEFRETCEALGDIGDEVVCALTPDPFSAVGLWYVDFSQTSDDEVRQLLTAHSGDVEGSG